MLHQDYSKLKIDTISEAAHKAARPTEQQPGRTLPSLWRELQCAGATAHARPGRGPAVTDWLHTAYTYDDLTTQRGWLTKTRVTSQDSSGFDVERLNRNLTYYANGNIEWVNQSATDTNNLSFSNRFQYDGLDRLRVMTSTNTTVFPSEQTAFDSLGRMTLRTLGGVGYSVSYGDSAHKDAPTGYLTNTYSYDAVGNQGTRTVSGATQSRVFDAENRLVQLSAGGVVSSYIYDANGQRLIKSVSTGDTTQRTLYIGSLYEETLGSKDPPYISYYQFGGKLVGMHRANQTTSNGQYRLIEDQLGSATLVVDTSTPAQVVQRQYHKPYGEVAWQYTAGGSLTSINFTGQRLDSDSCRIHRDQGSSALGVIQQPYNPPPRQMRYNSANASPRRLSMLAALFLPDPTVLQLEHTAIEEQWITLTIRTTPLAAPCPTCGQATSRVHSHYIRTVADLPTAAQPVRWQLHTRRFLCPNAACPRRTFAERLPTVVALAARRTVRQATRLHQTGLRVGGEVGAQLLQASGIPVSPDTVLRFIRRTPLSAGPTPRVLGVDDFVRPVPSKQAQETWG